MNCLTICMCLYVRIWLASTILLLAMIVTCCSNYLSLLFFLQFLGWSSLLLASVSCTAADSEGNTKTHNLKQQFVPPHIHHDTIDHREKLHWLPKKVAKDEKQSPDYGKNEPVVKEKNTLNKIEERILEGDGDKVDGGKIEKQSAFIPALRKAPLVVQVFALLQLSVSLAALSGE